MNTTNLTTNLPTSLPELQVPAHLATSIASAELLRNAAIRQAERDVYTTREDDERKARTEQLVKVSRKFMDTADVIAFYAARYGATPVSAPAPVAPYSHEQAIADAQAAGLPYRAARRISLDAVDAGVTGIDYRAFVDAHIAMHKDDVAAERARNAAKWAQISA